MATTTPNFGWPVPTSTDLVKDGATAMEALGDAIDTSMVDLKGGTTGQVLSKNSNTDMDFVWVTNADGDITGVTVTSPLTGGGTSGTVTVGILSGTTSNLGAVQLSDSTSSTSTTLAATANAVKTTYDLAASAYAPAFTNNFYAGKNKIINGDFGIWQRGTSFSSPTSGSYLADRYYVAFDGSPTVTYSRQTFTPGTAPVAGYEGVYFFRAAMTNASTTTSWNLYQKIENVQTFAGQTITVSFWAKADSTRSIGFNFLQEFGSGGSGAVFGGAGQTVSATTSWQRFTYTLTLPSIAGKTIGTGSSLTLYITLPQSATTTIDIWGVQVEAGSTATPFQTATGSIEGELSACQRYFIRLGGNKIYEVMGLGYTDGNTETYASRILPVTMRTTPSTTFATASLFRMNSGGGTVATGTGIAMDSNASSPNLVNFYLQYSSTGSAGRGAAIQANNSTSATMDISAEL